jgi:eukaryotic-like serine/threonine-protein kinase
MSEDDFHKQKTWPHSSSKSPFEEHIPAFIGPYKVETLLEKGGMSLLYLATHPETKEPITIKVLFPEFVSSPEMVQRFLREAEIIKLADHPNIVKLYGQGEWEGGLYIAMEFIQGISLKHYLRSNLISLKHALEIVMEISMALCHLHGHGVIHRDLKPENILITESGGVKVIDFGIAQLLTDMEENGLHQRRLIGTPIYMSPEQRQDPTSTSYPSDIYSLGIITYELVLGKLSHGQIHLSLMPKGLQKILSKALQPKPEDRYLDVVDFMADISYYLNSSALLKENKELVPFSELSESLRHAQHSLVPQKPPAWPKCDIGFASYKNLGTSSLYYDFFEISENAFGVIIGEPSVKGSPGIVYASVLRGMVRALCQLTQKPEELATILNALLLDDPMKQVFAFSYLILLPQENSLRFISCGLGHLWYLPNGSPEPLSISADHMALGVNPYAQFKEEAHPWQVGDTAVLYAFQGAHPHLNSLFSKTSIQTVWQEYADFSTQKKIDILLRNVKISLSRTADEQALFLFGIQRVE